MDKKEKTNKGCFRERLCKSLDIDPDILPHGSMIEIKGRNSLMVRGETKIIVYTPEIIRIKIGEGILSVSGERLICTSYYANAVGIEGMIESVSFGE